MTILRLSNDATTPFAGYLRCNVDVPPPHPVGYVPDQCNYVLGRPCGVDTTNLSVYVVLQPSERKTIDLTQAVASGYSLGPAPSNEWLGGVPVVFCGVPMVHVASIPNGCGYDVHYRCRVGHMLHVNLHLHWIPQQPAWCEFECIIDASNPSVPDVVESIPSDFRLVVGDADVLIPGLPDNAPLMSASDWLADAQPRLLAGVLYWDRHSTSLLDEDPARAVADQLVQVNGLKRLYQHGNVQPPPGFDGKAWTKALLPDVIRAQHDWTISPLDPAVVSQSTGAQGSQPLTIVDDPSCIGPIYLAGLDVSYPMCPLETNGEQLDWKTHPGLRMFAGRVNRALPSADNLGKLVEPSSYDRHGYAGPGYEWHFDFTAWAAARLKGTPATQWVLESHARLLMFTLPTASTPDNWLPPNRGVGWWLFDVAELYRGLRNRELAEALKALAIEMFTTLIVPRMGTADGWWSWNTSGSIGASPTDPRAMTWQCSVFALGLRLAGDALGHSGMVTLGTTVAEDVIARAWFHDGSRWHHRDLIAKDGRELGFHDAYYPHFGIPHAIAAELLWNPGHATAQAIRRQLEEDCTTWERASWLAPLDVQP